VLKADVEVDRRDFTLRAAIAVAPGERLALFGPSGAGKTTLLETIAGLVQPKTGMVELAGRTLTRTSSPRIAVPPWRRRVGLLRQDPGLFPHLSVRGNLAYARTADPHGTELAVLADALGIDDLLTAMPARLSGGQQHRAALARLLLAHCDALLLDEPYSGLDAVLRRTLTALVVRLVTERGVPAVLVAHELADAQAFANRMAVLDGGQILQVGDPDQVVLKPSSTRVAELVGYLGFVQVPGQQGVVAGIHPDRVSVGESPDRGIVLTGTVAACRPAGAGWEADLRLRGSGSGPGSTVICRLADRPGPEGSELVLTAIDPPCFGPDGAPSAYIAAGPAGSAGQLAAEQAEPARGGSGP
jgi:ABC-type sulfate/molybdate transport systems ATPase subunit